MLRWLKSKAYEIEGNRLSKRFFELSYDIGKAIEKQDEERRISLQQELDELLPKLNANRNKRFFGGP
jgi:hypothetical protein